MLRGDPNRIQDVNVTYKCGHRARRKIARCAALLLWKACKNHECMDCKMASIKKRGKQ